MTGIVRNLDYANFKDEVARHYTSRAHVYSRVWSVLGDLQPGGPYGA
jgi:predicted metallopeptidase